MSTVGIAILEIWRRASKSYLECTNEAFKDAPFLWAIIKSLLHSSPGNERFSHFVATTVTILRSYLQLGGHLCQKSPQKENWVNKPPDGTWVTCLHIKPAPEDKFNITQEEHRTINIDSTNYSISPVVLIPGPGPDGKPVTKPPEGSWVKINPRLAGLYWVNRKTKWK